MRWAPLGAVLVWALGFSSASAPVSPCDALPQGATPPVTLARVVEGFDRPVYLTHAGDGSGRLFVVEQPGTIRVVQDGRVLSEPFLDLRQRVRFGGEQGLLSVAFHPGFGENGRLFVNYTAEPDGHTVVAEYRVSAEPDRADPREAVILEVAQPFPNHNGGQLQFGPDGFLYVGLGDGGAGGDPLGHGQDLGTWLGALLRLDVDGTAPYAVPTGNPFVDRPGARPEIYAYGLRNPWRFSFDRCDGRLFLADVGQNRWEEVNLIKAGGNYGWNVMEGDHCFRPAVGCRPEGLERPLAEYDHGPQGGRSITGGYVYRGTQLPELAGRYFFADFVSGRLWALRQAETETWPIELLVETGLSVSSCGEDEAGELYLVDYGGAIYRVQRAR